MNLIKEYISLILIWLALLPFIILETSELLDQFKEK